MKKAVIIISVLAVAGAGAYFGPKLIKARLITKIIEKNDFENDQANREAIGEGMSIKQLKELLNTE